jgi:hypothetical protein
MRTHTFQNLHINFAVGKSFYTQFTQIHIQVIADFLREGKVGIAGENTQVPVYAFSHVF